MKKVIVSVLLVILLVLTIIPKLVFAVEERTVTPDYSWYEDGSKTTYEIATVEQLVGLANIVNGKAEGIEKDSFDNKTIKLRKNIDLTNITWTPIGSSMYDHSPDDSNTKMFEGTFDGTYHTISGLSSKNYQALPEDISSGEHSYGLFGYAYGASFKNLSLSDVSISCSGEAGADGAGVAALIGFYVTKDNEKSVIENIKLTSGTVKATNNMGGIIGYMEVSGSQTTLDITIKNCINNAEVITDAREAGGILGLFQNSDRHKGSLKFINCINNGTITANAGGGNSVASGILGKEQSYSGYTYEFKVYFNNCVNNGNINAVGRKNGEVHASGITTVYYTRGAPIEINHCINNGDITITGEGTDNFIGGLVAHPALGESNKIYDYFQNNSYNTGELKTISKKVVFLLYDVNGAEGQIESHRTNIDKNLVLDNAETLSKTGYIFDGWNTKIDGTGTSYQAGSTFKIEETITLYAQWKKIKEDWYVKSIPSQFYTGEPIKPLVYVYTENDELISPDKYTVLYDSDCISAGKHKVIVTYNGETIEEEYEIVKHRPELTVNTSQKEIDGREEIEIKIEGTSSDDIEVICDDPDVIIVKKDNNTYIAKIPNKNAEYQFTAIYKDNNDHFKDFQSILIKGTHNPLDDMLPPNTMDNLSKIILFTIISLAGIFTTFILIKKVKE